MGSRWDDEIWDEDLEQDGDSIGEFYCPYTNTSVCALLTKGWQPQELCRDLECDQLGFIERKPRRQKRAA